MKQDNSQNIQAQNVTIPGRVEDILKILWINEESLQSEASNVSSGIDDVLKIYEVAQEKGIANLNFSNKQDVKKAMDIIAIDASVFGKLTKDFREDVDVWKQTLKSYLEEWKSFLEVQDFIAKNFSKKKQPALSQFYRDHIRMTSDIFLTSIEKQLLDLDEKNPKLYKSISAKLLQQNQKSFVLRSRFLNHFTKSLSKNPEYHNLSEQERDSFDISIFQNYLWLKKTEMTPDMLMLFLSLRELIHIKKAQQEIEEEEKENDEELDNVSESDDTNEYRTYSPLFVTEDTIDMWAGQSIKLTEKEMQMNDTALENYVTAVKTCDDLGLWFIFRHKHQFLSVICGIDYLSGEWITESKLLKILNKIGKKIGIPEKELSEDKDGTKVIGCFKTFWEAKSQFRDIRDTWVVGWVSYDPMKSDRTVAERVLIQKWFFHLEWKGFTQVEKW